MTADDTGLGRRFGPSVVVFDILGQRRSLFQLTGTYSPGAPRNVQGLGKLL